jgi:hypothetical protein
MITGLQKILKTASFRLKIQADPTLMFASAVTSVTGATAGQRSLLVIAPRKLLQKAASIVRTIPQPGTEAGNTLRKRIHCFAVQHVESEQ